MTWSLMQIVLTAYINVATYSHTAAEIGIWQLYTVNHKKRATLFSIINPALLALYL